MLDVKIRFVNKGIGLREIFFTITKEEKFCIIGASGSGKTTLLKAIAGLEHIDDGEVFYNNEKVKGPYEQLIPGHPKLLYLSQHYELPPFRTVVSILTETNPLRDKLAEKDTDALKLYKDCEIEHLLPKKTTELSGGEKQRVALALLLLKKPDIILLDEPFSNLDPIHKQIISNVLNNVSQSNNTSYILTSHSPEDYLSWASKILILKNGSVVQFSSTHDAYFQPTSTYSAAMLGKFNLISRPLAEKLFSTNLLLDCWKIGEDYFFRPEQLLLKNINESGTEAEIKKVQFKGPYNEIEIITLTDPPVFLTSFTKEKFLLGSIVKVDIY